MAEPVITPPQINSPEFFGIEVGTEEYQEFLLTPTSAGFTAEEYEFVTLDEIREATNGHYLDPSS